MWETVDILKAFLTGLLSGIILSIPVGPVNLTIMNEGTKLGFQRAFLIGLGASTMETIYCSIAFTGLASFFNHGIIKSAMEVGSCIFLIVLGVKVLTQRSVPTRGIMEDRVEKTFHPHTAFMNGFFRVLGNPGVLVFWIILAALFITREWVVPNRADKIACVAGVAMGTSSWFAFLSVLVSKGYGRLKDSTLLKMEKWSGIALILLGAADGVMIAIELARKQHHHLQG